MVIVIDDDSWCLAVKGFYFDGGGGSMVIEGCLTVMAFDGPLHGHANFQ